MALVITPTLSVLVSVWLETPCYGINTVIYLICLYLLIARKPPQKTRKALVVLSTLLDLSATAHISVNLRRLIEGYVLSRTKGEMMNYLVDIAHDQPLGVAEQYLVVSTSFLSDLIIRITVVPVWLSREVLGLGVATSVAIAKPGQTIFFQLTASFGTAMLSLIMNVTETTLIASRIWSISRTSQTFTKARSSVQVVSSSGPASATLGNGSGSSVLISIVQLFILAFYLAKHPAVYFMADLSVQVDPMAPLMMIAFIELLNAGPAGRNWMNTTALDSRNTSGDTERRPVIPSVPRVQLRCSLTQMRSHTSLSGSMTGLESKKDLPERSSVGGKETEVTGIAV